jgi:glycine dehydrogenase subunit 2
MEGVNKMSMDNNVKVRRFHQAKWDEPIIFELGSKGERGILLPEVEPEIEEAVGSVDSLVPDNMKRRTPPSLPEISQPQVLRHYLHLAQETLGTDVNIDISQGTCTMKYSPKVNETFVRSPKFSELHPLQDEDTVQGILEIMYKFGEFLKEISGLYKFTFQPGGGSQAVYSNASIIRAYHESNGEGEQRNEIITTIFSHPSNAASPSTAGYKVITLMPDENGYPDIEALKAAVSERTAALFITNPEDTGIFNPKIKEYVDIVHSVGGLCAYDQANANGLLGLTRAKEAGFDMCHFNLHKTFSSPHGCMGPACGAQGVVEKLAKFMPVPVIEFDGSRYYLNYDKPDSIGKLRKFYGVPAAVLRAYAYVMSLGAEGLKEVAELAILNNNYLLKHLREIPGVTVPYAEGRNRVEQVRYSWEKLKQETGVGTEDVGRRIVDFGVQTYFRSHHPWVVPEPFTLEPVETYSKADIDEYIAILKRISHEAYTNPDIVKTAPHNSTIAKIDPAPLNDINRLAVTWRAYKRKLRNTQK